MIGPKITQGFQWEMGQRKGLFGLPDIEVVAITGREFGEDAEAVRAGAMMHLNEVRHRVGKAGIRNMDTGWALTIGRNDWSKIAKDQAQPIESLQSVFEIEKLAQLAVLAESHEDTMHRNPDIQAVHRMFAAIETDRVPHRVKLTIRDYTGVKSGDRTNLHALETHIIDEIKIEQRPDLGSLSSTVDNTGAYAFIRASKVNITDLLAKSTRQDGSAWNFSDTGVRTDRSPKPKLDFEPDFGM